MITAYAYDDKWILAHDVYNVNTGGFHAPRSHRAERTVSTFEKCWSGEKWASLGHFTKTFDSEELAQEYLSAHQSEMLDAL